jgi:hypothetical protein
MLGVRASILADKMFQLSQPNAFAISSKDPERVITAALPQGAASACATIFAWANGKDPGLHYEPVRPMARVDMFTIPSG